MFMVKKHKHTIMLPGHARPERSFHTRPAAPSTAEWSAAGTAAGLP